MRGYSRDHERIRSISNSYLALADFRTTVQLDSSHSKAWAALGRILGDNGALDSAIICYNKAVRLDSSLALGYYGRGLTYMSMKMLDSAMADCERSLALDPDYGKSFDLRGCIKYRLGDYVGSARDIYRCIAMDGDSASAVSYCNLGAAEHMLGLLDIEMDAYHKSIAIDSTYPDPYYNLARVLDRDRENTKAAAPLYEKYLIYAKDTDSTAIAFVRARLDSISRGL
ncbi:MAG: tetratricopeptide repeat protein [Candidatus Zixiibacteriota bacterium]